MKLEIQSDTKERNKPSRALSTNGGCLPAKQFFYDQGLKKMSFSTTTGSSSYGGGELRERQHITSVLGSSSSSGGSTAGGIAPHLQNSRFDDVQLFDDRGSANLAPHLQQSYHHHQGGVHPQTHSYDPSHTNTNYNQFSNVMMMNEKYQSGSSFLYNKRIVPILIVSMIPVLTLAGKYSLFVLLMGLLGMYTLDFLQQKAYAFLTFWVSLCLFWASIYTTSASLLWISVFNIFVLLNGSLFVMLTGFWASLQSEWFKTFSPDLVFVTERLVFAMLPVVTIPLVISVVVGLVGIANAPFYLVGVLCLYAFLVGRREVSSFSKNRYIQHPLESRVLISMIFLLPPVFHIFIYHNTFMDNFASHLYALNALVALALLFISSDPAGYLWAFNDSAYDMIINPARATKGVNLKIESHNTMRYFVQLISLALLNLWIEFRVIVPRYHYLIPFGSPWDKIIVFGALNTLASFLLLAIYNQNYTGPNKNSLTKSLLTIFMVTASFFGGILIGLPFYLLPFPIIAMFFGVSYTFEKKVYKIWVFVGCTMICALWFVAHHFWFLKFEFGVSFLPFNWSLRMTHSTMLILFLLAVSMLAIPYTLPSDDESTPKAIGTKEYFSTARNVILIAQVLLLALLEQLLYEQAEGFYSPTLIIITTGFGVVFCKRLFQLKLISIDTVSLLTSLYISKLAIMLSQQGVYGTYISAVFATVSFSRMYYATITNDGDKTFSASPATCVFYIFASGITLFLTRNVLLKTMMSVLIDTRFYDMNQAHLFGFFCIAWGIAILPLSINYMKHNSLVKRFNVFLILIGLIVAVLQPSLAFFSFSDISSSSVSGTAGFAGDFNSLEKTSESLSDFIPWIVIVTLVVLFSLDIISLGERSNLVIRIAFFVLVAVGFSISFSGLYLYYTRIWTHLTILVTMVIAALVIYTTHFPLNHSYQPSLFLFAAFVITLPVTYLSISIDEESLKQKNSFLKAESLHPSTYSFVLTELTKSARIAVLGLYCALSALIAILIKFKLIGYPLIRIRKANKVLNVKNDSESASQTIDPYLSVPGSDELSVVNNGATVACFVLCIALTTWLNPDRYEAYLLFCCIFLLLNRDSQLLSEFKDSLRFIVVLLAMEVCMAMFFMIDTILFFSTSATSPNTSFDGMISQYALKFLLLILTLPSHILFIRFLMRLNKPNTRPILMSLPFSLLSAILTIAFSLYLDNFYSLIYITVSAVGASILQAMISAQYVREQVILL